MEKTDIREIANFMGIPIRNYSGDVFYICDEYGDVDFKNDPTVYAPHNNWNQLMQVVEKIISIDISEFNYNVDRMSQFKFERQKITLLKITIPKAILYKSCIEFIKFYNSQKGGDN